MVRMVGPVVGGQSQATVIGVLVAHPVGVLPILDHCRVGTIGMVRWCARCSGLGSCGLLSFLDPGIGLSRGGRCGCWGCCGCRCAGSPSFVRVLGEIGDNAATAHSADGVCRREPMRFPLRRTEGLRVVPAAVDQRRDAGRQRLGAARSA